MSKDDMELKTIEVLSTPERDWPQAVQVGARERAIRAIEELKRFREREPLVQELLEATERLIPDIYQLEYAAKAVRDFKIGGE